MYVTSGFFLCILSLYFGLNSPQMFSQATKYAIKSVIYIWTQSLEDRKVGAKEIGANIEAPEAFTDKILQLLTKAKIVGSIKGPNGGFFADE